MERSEVKRDYRSQRVFQTRRARSSSPERQHKVEVWWKLLLMVGGKSPEKFPKINLCFPQNESNKTPFARVVPRSCCTHSFEWQGGLCRFFLVGCYFWTRRLDSSCASLLMSPLFFFLSSRSWMRVFIISEIKRLIPPSLSLSGLLLAPLVWVLRRSF